MALTPSTMLELASEAPAFELSEATDGRTVTLDEAAADKKALVVMFICAHCPFVKHVENQIAQLANDYRSRGVGFVAICSNDAGKYVEDAPPALAEQKRRLGWDFPYLVDETQDVAKAYRAACTPDFYVFDGDKKLAYRGQLDSSRPNSGESTGADLRAALDAVLAGDKPTADQQPSMGCNIKWKPGNAPDYA